MRVTPASTGLTPFEMMYGGPYFLPQLKPFHRIDEEADQTLADYMRKMLTNRKVFCANSLPGTTEEKTETPVEKVTPGDWVLIKAIKKKNWSSPRDEQLSAIAEAPEIETLEQSLHDMSVEEEELDENTFNDHMNSVIDWAEERPTFHSDPDDSSDEEYLPPISLRMGGALKGAQLIDNLPTIGIDETVHDLPAPEVLSDEPLSLEQPILPGPHKILSEDDIVGVRAAVIYENSLRQLVTFLTLPVHTCTGVLRNGLVCDSVSPFSTNITIRGTAMSFEWICPNGHCQWRWNSQPVLQFGKQAGDFLLSTNILLSGNNYAKVALLLKFMNVRMFNPNTHFTIQDTYCVDTIKEYREQKRSEAISRLQGKDVVLLDKRQTNWNSNIMEKEGFIQTVEKLTKEIKVVEFCKDAHVKIGALLRMQRHPRVRQDQPLFLTDKGKAMSRSWFTTRLHLLCQRCGLPPQLYTSHSFRIGAATSTAALVPTSTLKAMGHWSSSAYERCIRPGVNEIISAQKATSANT
ncbi:hypothetical protein F2P81_002622 [Scophthalmus maximus]|uniref:Tyr recombinase domain-containing protein n=1 Tax=Scophthalmus maximus TaxID=52904 RepID=A0A6A4TJA0_SCOMX|nr:hypothetical protein F2P81_002622 [Scophthalmus maximus]